MLRLRRLPRILLGLAAAIALASISVTTAIWLVMRGDGDAAVAPQWLGMFGLTMMLIGLAAGLPALAIALYADARGHRGWPFPVLCGAATGLSFPLAALLLGDADALMSAFGIGVLLFGAVTGALAGLAYWAVAGRSAG